MENIVLPEFKMVESSFDRFETEILYPFGNYKIDGMQYFIIPVKSPKQFYYTDIFASFLLTVDEAWNLYQRLLELQVDDSEHITGDEILSRIPTHMDTLEKQFKSYYTQAYKNIIEKIDLNNYKYY